MGSPVTTQNIHRKTVKELIQELQGLPDQDAEVTFGSILRGPEPTLYRIRDIGGGLVHIEFNEFIEVIPND